MARYDIETFCSDLDTFLKANLNAKLLQLDSEKNDGITLLPVGASSYFFQTLNDTVTNYNPFIYYGVDQVQTEGIGPATRRAYSIDIVLCFTDSGGDAPGVVAKRLFRYSRALEEIFLENWRSIGSAPKIKLQSLAPVSFKFLNSSDEYRAIGVTLDFTMV